MWIIFGYKNNSDSGDFLAGAKTKEQLNVIEKIALQHEYVKFNYLDVNGTVSDFIKTINCMKYGKYK